MAFVREDDDDGQRKFQKQRLSRSGGGAFGTTNTVNSPGVQQKGSGQFTNLRQYMDVNQDQTEQFADDTVDRLQTGIDDKASYINDVELSDFQGQVNEGTFHDDEALRSRNARDIIADENLANQYRSRLNAEYGGPDAFTSPEGFQQIDNYNQGIQGTSTFTGKKDAAKMLYGGDRANYTSGEQNLDGVFLNQPISSREKFKDLRDYASGLTEDTKTNVTDSANQMVAEAIATTDQTRQAFQNDLSNDRTHLDNSVQSSVDALNKNRMQEYEQAIADAKAAELNAWDKFNNPDGINQRDYISYGGDIGWQQAITEDQLAEAAALAQLYGDPNSNVYLAGRQDPGDSYNFDETQYNQDVSDLKVEGTKLKQNFDSGVNSIENAETNDSVKRLKFYHSVGGNTGTGPGALQGDIQNLIGSEIPNNPMGFKTYGEYLRSLGVDTSSVDSVINYFANKYGWQRSPGY